MRSTLESVLLDEICGSIVEAGHYPLVWIGRIENNIKSPVSIAAQRSFDKQDLQAIASCMTDNGVGSGAMKLAINNGKPLVIKDLAGNPDYQPILQLTKKYHLATAAILPISASAKNYAALNIYTTAADDFDEEEILILQELADDLGFGVTALRTQIEHQQLQRQLQQSQKMESIGQLTGGIAHDFNNILAIIMGYSEMALKRYAGNSDAKLTGYLNEIPRAGTRARDLVSNMLAFSQNTEISAKPVALEPAVKEIIALLKATIPSSIRIQTEIEGNILNVMMDPVHLHQLVMNLCINARDSLASEGMIKVIIRQSTNIDTECNSCHAHITGNFVELAIEDTGSGIEAADIDRIFDPFYSTKDVGQGTGMGLSVVHGLVHEHDGHISVATKKGKGSVFRLLFPAASGDTEDENIDSKDFTGGSTLPGSNRHLLVVDDDIAVADYLTELLQLAGYQVTAKSSSTEALAAFKQNTQNFDLIITDQTMPGYTGAELAKKILQIRPNIPVILCTGYSEVIDENEARDQGIQRFLQKPVSSRILLQSLSEILPVEGS